LTGNANEKNAKLQSSAKWQRQPPALKTVAPRHENDIDDYNEGTTTLKHATIDNTFFRRKWNDEDSRTTYLVKPSLLPQVLNHSKPCDDYHGGGYCRACGVAMDAGHDTVFFKFVFAWTPDDNDCFGFMHTTCEPVLNAAIIEAAR
jgi:hypothetical protein